MSAYHPQPRVNKEAAECALLGLLDMIPDNPTKADMQIAYKTAAGLSILSQFGLERTYDQTSN
ncbi:MAG: hypothetical protein J7K40_06060 [candidate division Zixibacteria bacterium]|nr:hypothetical protein [candidate division Zixibacteria bacterium]